MKLDAENMPLDTITGNAEAGRGVARYGDGVSHTRKGVRSSDRGNEYTSSHEAFDRSTRRMG